MEGESNTRIFSTGMELPESMYTGMYVGIEGECENGYAPLGFGSMDSLLLGIFSKWTGSNFELMLSLFRRSLNGIVLVSSVYLMVGLRQASAGRGGEALRLLTRPLGGKESGGSIFRAFVQSRHRKEKASGKNSSRGLNMALKMQESIEFWSYLEFF